MATPHETAAHCPHCGAELQAPGGECWLCRLKEPPAQPNPYASPRPIGDYAAQFSLASLFLVMTLVAVCLGVFMLAPGLGILLAVAATPALVRTTFTASYYKQAGASLTTAWKIKAFLVSLFIMLAVGTATFVAFQGRVERWRGGLGGAYLLPALSFAGASLAQPCSVSTSRSSNRTCRFPASGFRTRNHA